MIWEVTPTKDLALLTELASASSIPLEVILTPRPTGIAEPVLFVKSSGANTTEPEEPVLTEP